jgi:hypothetical protein
MSTHTSAWGDLEWRVYACESGACVGVAREGQNVFIGNTNNLQGPVSEFTTDEWRRFLTGVKLGHFDDIG